MPFFVFDENLTVAKRFAKLLFESSKKILGIGNRSNNPVSVADGAASAGLTFDAIAIAQAGVMDYLVS